MIIKECCNHSNTARKANNMNEIINNWDLILNTFKNECDIQNLSFTTFIKPLQVISVSDNEITLLSDTQMSANYVEKRYLKFLEVTISEIMKKDYKLRIISEDTLNELNNKFNQIDNGSFVKITFYKNGKYSEIKRRVTNIDYIKKKIQINKEYNINICDIVSILI